MGLCPGPPDPGPTRLPAPHLPVRPPQRGRGSGQPSSPSLRPAGRPRAGGRRGGLHTTHWDCLGTCGPGHCEVITSTLWSQSRTSGASGGGAVAKARLESPRTRVPRTPSLHVGSRSGLWPLSAQALGPVQAGLGLQHPSHPQAQPGCEPHQPPMW